MLAEDYGSLRISGDSSFGPLQKKLDQVFLADSSTSSSTSSPAKSIQRARDFYGR